MMSRRELLIAALLAGSALGKAGTKADAGVGALQQGVADLERRHGGRLGVAVLDTGRRRRVVAHRGNERFPLCSTYKLLAAAFVLARVDRGQESLRRRIVYAQDVLVPYSPITQKHVGGIGLTMGELCEAALTVSDNTAANLLLGSLGGPAGLTAYVRSLGDTVTRLDRQEPEVNTAIPGDPRDTSTPFAMLQTLDKIVSGNTLSGPSHHQLVAWLVACRTGTQRLRAGAPPGWRVGDKTGSGAHGVTNDIAIFWPPQRAPILVIAFYAESPASADERSAVLCEVGRLAALI